MIVMAGFQGQQVVKTRILVFTRSGLQWSVRLAKQGAKCCVQMKMGRRLLSFGMNSRAFT